MALPVIFKNTLPTAGRARRSLPAVVVAPLCVLGVVLVPWWVTAGAVVFAGWRFWQRVGARR